MIVNSALNYHAVAESQQLSIKIFVQFVTDAFNKPFLINHFSMLLIVNVYIIHIFNN